MDIKSLVAFVLDPKLLAVVGGYLSYQYLGKKKEGYERYAYAGGGAVAGYFAGYLAQKFLKPADPFAGAKAQASGQPQVPPVSEYDMLDLDATPVPQRRALPPPRSYADPRDTIAQAQMPAAPPAEPVDVRGAGADDSALLHSLGYFEGTGEEGLGSYDSSLDGDVDVDEALQDAGFKRPAN